MNNRPTHEKDPKIGKARKRGGGDRRRSNDLNDLRRKIKSNSISQNLIMATMLTRPAGGQQPEESRTTFQGGSINPNRRSKPFRMQWALSLLPSTRDTKRETLREETAIASC